MIYPKTTRLLHELQENKIVPGVSYALFASGKFQSESFGFSQILPCKKFLKPNMLYDVASLTKVIGTTTVILKLLEQRKIALDEPICRYLPRFKDRRVTVRHLLTHTSAINGYIKNRNQLVASDLLTALYGLEVGDWIGEKVVYSDIGLIFLGEIIEHFYQRPVQEVIVTEVLTPLEMFDSTFEPTDLSMCVPTQLDEKRGLICGQVHDPKAFILKKHCGSAGLFSSLNDLVKFSQWLLDSKDQRVLTSKTIELLFADQTPNNKLGRSLGWDLRFNKKGALCLYHTGFTGTFMLLDRSEQKGLIVLTNRIHPTGVNQLFLDKRDEIVMTYLNE